MTPKRISSRRLRIAGLLTVAALAWYLPWLVRSVNVGAWWLSIPYVLATFFSVMALVISWINNWTRSCADVTTEVDLSSVVVSIIIPTCGEPVSMVRSTLLSVFSQDWPLNRMAVAVGDDARSPRMEEMVESIAASHPELRLIYYVPPARDDPLRRGEAKAGNLNAGVAVLRSRGLLGDVIETRDADDLVGAPDFLRQCVQLLVANPSLAYVQTIKDSAVAEGDPFGNRELVFYQGTMFARDAGSSVFPCGSGVVWSTKALGDIGGFPTWNLVEDLQSGIEALRRGWRGAYLPIVGAFAQSAPEDIPNVYKQRGTWALDTVRLMLWGNLRGLSWRQRLQFYELALFYVQSLCTICFLAMPIIGLALGIYPLHTDNAAYALHFWPQAVCIEVYLCSLNVTGGFDAYWRARQLWVGLTFVHAWAVIRAIGYGPNRKPRYQVTRKNRIPGFYWRQVLPQFVVVAGLGVSVLVALARGSIENSLDLGSCYWGVLFALLLVGFLRRAWFGESPWRLFISTLRARRRRGALERFTDLRSTAIPPRPIPSIVPVSSIEQAEAS